MIFLYLLAISLPLVSSCLHQVLHCAELGLLAANRICGSAPPIPSCAQSGYSKQLLNIWSRQELVQ